MTTDAPKPANEFAKLSEPFVLGARTLRNRIVFPAMATGFASRGYTTVR